MLAGAADSGVSNPWQADPPDYQFPALSFSGPAGSGGGTLGWYLGGWSSPSHCPRPPPARPLPPEFPLDRTYLAHLPALIRSLLTVKNHV